MEELAARSQQFWLPLERAGGQQLGQLLVSLLFTKVRGCRCCSFRCGVSCASLRCGGVSAIH